LPFSYTGQQEKNTIRVRDRQKTLVNSRRPSANGIHLLQEATRLGGTLVPFIKARVRCSQILPHTCPTKGTAITNEMANGGTRQLDVH
jgi:hypothetical protein